MVTSLTGAALRDVLHVLARRNPALRLVLAPCRVQGAGAAEEIAASIRLLNDWSAAQATAAQAETFGPPPGGLDLILVTRGGGSLEDLWAFNEEAVARAIAASALPVVSAVGHEIDFTISDFVADLRAATPSAAAELLSEGAVGSREFLAGAAERLGQLAARGCAQRAEDVARLRQRLARSHPRSRLEDHFQRLDELLESLVRRGRAALRERTLGWAGLAARWRRLRPVQALVRRAETLQRLVAALRERVRLRERAARQCLDGLCERLRLLSPTHVLARGFSITLDEQTGHVIRSAAHTHAGQSLTTRLHDGEVRSVVS
jgi:exodeoxyribonuclease VII large subunit